MDEAVASRSICHHCVGEDYLRYEIRRRGKKQPCSYCGRLARTYTIAEMAARIDSVFAQHYYRTADFPDDRQGALLADEEASYTWDRYGDPVVYAIMDGAIIPEAAASDIQQFLDDQYSDLEAAKMGEETEYAPDSYYELKGPDDSRWQDEWREFEHTLKTEARFFSGHAGELLSKVFDGIDGMLAPDGRPVVVAAGPGSSIASVYRARVFQAEEKLAEALARPDRYLGPPPPALARAGRMNAHGISVFYGAEDRRVALAEVRPPVSSWVVVARFEITRSVQLLDLDALSTVDPGGSVFDPGSAERRERAAFLRKLSERIRKPVLPDDEPFEYLVTQAVADFLATDPALKLDGIVFPSVQTGAAPRNVVLFHQAARVQDIGLPEDAGFTVSLGQMYDEGWEEDFHVTEEVLPEPGNGASSAQTYGQPVILGGLQDHPIQDLRQITLSIDLNSVTVHIIEAVEFKSRAHRVPRWRCEKHEPDPPMAFDSV